MKPFPRRVARAMLLRSFAVQGSWNYRTLIGTGMAFVLAPALRHLYAGDPERLRAATARHARLFNSHPYLTPLAAGALARLEAEGAPPETQERFKTALRSSLGSLGDRLVWLVWRPASALLMLTLVLLGVPVWLAVAVFLVVYNAVHLWLRLWGLRAGLRDGMGVAGAIRDAPFYRLGEHAGRAGAALAGFSAVLALGTGEAAGWGYAAAGAAAIGLGLMVGSRVRTAAALALTAALAAGILLAANP